MLIITFLCLLLLVVLLKVFHKLWWTPIRIQRFMNLQGIKGPSYKFLHGTTKEMIRMQMEAKAKPMSSLSHNIFPRLHPHIYVWANLYGKLFLEWYGPRPRLVINDPELAKEILSDKERVYGKPEIGSYLKNLLGGGLAFLDAEKLPKRRKLFHHAFHGDILKGMVPSMVEAVEKMIAGWKCHEEKEIEVFEQFRLLTSEIISRTAFGSSYLEGQNIFYMLSKLTVLTFANLNKIRFPGMSKLVKTQDQIESEKLYRGINQSITDIINKRVYKFQNGEEDNFGSDFLGLLLKSRHEAGDNKSITLQEVIAECKTIYYAGQKTVNSCLTWTMLLLSIHTDLQEEARKEVFDSLGKRKPNANDIAKLKKLGMIIHESLRLYPPASETSRQVKKQVRLGKHTIPAGTELFIPVLAFHHDPKIWGDDVHLFKPERFSEGVANATNDIKTSAFFPFGFGPRICVGMNFALVQTKIALAMILQNYSFTVSPNYVHSPIRGLTSVPQHGVQIMLRSL